jgi:hypothetical protein
VWWVVLVAGGGELDGVVGGGGVVAGAGGAEVPVVVRGARLLVVTDVAADFDLGANAFLGVAFLWVVVFLVAAAGSDCDACLARTVVLADPPQAASAVAATIVVARVRFMYRLFRSRGRLLCGIVPPRRWCLGAVGPHRL